MTTKRLWQAIIVQAMGLMLVLIAPTAEVFGSSSQRSHLVSTGVDIDARGSALMRVRGTSDGRLELRAKGLDAAATYEIVVDGVRVATMTTRSGGGGRIRFRSRPRNDRDELLGFDPRGSLVAVRDASGRDVLAVTIPVTSAGTTSDGDIICCIPDDSGPECEDRTPAECTAQGGTATTATSCLPNPCAGTPSPVGNDIVCCVPDDSGPECEDRTAAECAAQGGVAVEATSCNPNPCAGVPSADPDIRCCLPDDSGTECEDRTPAQCAVQGGVDLGAGSCLPNPCAGIPPQPGTASVSVVCELRDDRSKISVNGSGLTAGSYTARATSGSNAAVAPAQATIGDEVEFDFDSDSGDIGEGATPIAANFIQGTPPQAVGQILDAQGNIVAESVGTCEVK